jgi:hypothetical protein
VTTLINLWCGPGAGKSTTAAAVFAEAKLAGKSIELVTEYVKTWAWRGTTINQAFDAPYITAKQLRRESALYGKVDFIVTDSPIGLGAVYEQAYPDPAQAGGHGAAMMWNLCQSIRARQLRAGIRIVDCLLQRCKPYVTAGRYEDEAKARRIDQICQEHLSVLCGLSGYHVVQDAADVLRVGGVLL